MQSSEIPHDPETAYSPNSSSKSNHTRRLERSNDTFESPMTRLSLVNTDRGYSAERRHQMSIADRVCLYPLYGVNFRNIHIIAQAAQGRKHSD